MLPSWVRGGWRQSGTGVHEVLEGPHGVGLSCCLSEPTPCKARLCKENPLCSEASFHQGIGRTPTQVGKGTRKVQPEMRGSGKPDTVGRCSVTGLWDPCGPVTQLLQVQSEDSSLVSGTSLRGQVYLLKLIMRKKKNSTHANKIITSKIY